MNSLSGLLKGWRWIAHLCRVFLFHPRCVVCQAPLVLPGEGRLCSSCWSRIKPSGQPACPRCGTYLSEKNRLCGHCLLKPPPFLSTRCHAAYEGIFREVILRYKYGGVRGLARVLSGCLPPPPVQGKQVLLVPVPDDPGRRRDYSPLREIARPYASRYGLTFRPRALCKIRSTPPQAGLSLAARKRNPAGAYRCRSRRVRGRDVILLDDVFTTGSTLAACARELRRAGARVRVVTLARTP